MANRKVTDLEKRRRGSARPSTTRNDENALDFEAVAEIPPAPETLNIHGKAYWDRILPILMEKRVMTIADHESLEVACILYAKIRQAALAGVDVNAAAVTQFRLFQTEFGLTPASRAKLKAGDDAKGKNPFNTNGKEKT